ncbi:hypothetical protein KBK19_15200 [Microvirga sp. STR05]|uniref:DUF4381 domain-containing protein n=1 Tax=Hymenobacter duratus TaxID=2771356 RepID=A0ABR8JL80_9BACT|nr:hypothetical protein [Hymenobacter duratus]MBD2716386.1 hypothetical protein [Hymenobacter duratus]MBR7951301.1 hypothetical protein [Microvirga sp. STR05]
MSRSLSGCFGGATFVRAVDRTPVTESRFERHLDQPGRRHIPISLKRVLLLFGPLLLPLLAGGQATPDPPRGRFLRPTTRVGEIIEYELSYRHEPGLNVIFPDSTANYALFEYVGKKYQPTRTRQGISLDRTIYRLRTFSLDSVQRLQLPVTILRGRDTLLLPSTAAVVTLKRAAPQAAAGATPALRQNTVLLPVEPAFNYPYWLAGAALLLLVLGGAALAFGRRWRQRYQLYKVRKNHVYFLAQYARHVERFTLSRSLTNMERAITLWKNYLTNLENNTISSLTTREIVAHYQNDADVRLALRLADRVIYGNQFSEDDTETDLAFDLLRSFAERRFELVRQRLEN